MTAARALVRLMMILLVAAALPCRGEDVVSGRWEGAAQIPENELTLVVDLSQENGAWVGSIIIPGLGLKGVPLTDIKVQPSDVNFAVKGALGIQLKLRLDANNKLTGNFEQGGNRAPAMLQKTGPPQVEYPPRNTPVAKELEGEWKGDYEMLGYPRHVSIKFANHPDGATAEFVIVGRKHNLLPVDLVTQEGEIVMVDSHEMGFSFEGRLRNGKLMGAIRQAAMETQLVLVRAKLQSRFQAVSFCSPCFAQRRRSMLNRCFAEMRCTPVRMRDPRRDNSIVEDGNFLPAIV